MVNLPPKRRAAMLARLLRSLGAPKRAGTHPPLTPESLPAMAGKLEIVRDANGVPHIYAEVERDLYAVLGYLQGADRFMQIDAVRHLGAGRLCELVGNLRAPQRHELIGGKRVADVDLFIRALGLEARSRRDLPRLGDRGRASVEAFAEGVNAALRAMHGIYPAEYLVLGRVRPWEPADCLLAAQACALTVSLTPFDTELIFDAVRGHAGDDVARRLYPEAPWEQVPAGYRVTGPLETPEPPIHGVAGAGSNNWAVAAPRSSSGAPMVANDPHVPLIPLPTFWYHAHLDCPSYRVQGGVFPGCPVFGFGHNGHLAWGVTTAYRDGWDLYRIHRLPDDPGRYRTAAGSGPIHTRRELHRTRGRRPVALEWEECEHGILYPGWRHHDGVELAVRYVDADLASYLDGGLDLAAATTVEAHRAALERLNEGPFDFNHVYGHRDGHIGWEMYGRLPRRRGDGLFVRDAQDPAAQWDGYLRFDENPKQINPARGFVASANAITDPDNFRPIATAVHFEPGYRHARIEAVLAAAPSHGDASFAALQSDCTADYGPPVRDRLVDLLSSYDGGSGVLAGALRALREWDGVFACDSGAAAVFFFTVHDCCVLVFTALLGGSLGRRYANGRKAMPRLYRLLLDEADPLRADLERAGGRPLQHLVDEAFRSAVRRITDRCGGDARVWRWGAFQRARLGTPLALLPRIGRRALAFDGPFPGDEYTVSPSRSLPLGGQLLAFVGATSRFICDLGRPDEALFAHSSGPSADVGSAFYANLSPAWARFEYFRSALWAAQEVPGAVERLRVE
jgi:penicillin amidase